MAENKKKEARKLDFNGTTFAKNLVTYLAIGLTIALSVLIVVAIYFWIKTGADLHQKHTDWSYREVLAEQAKIPLSLFKIKNTYNTDSMEEVVWGLSGFGIGMCVWFAINICLAISAIALQIVVNSEGKKPKSKK